MSPRFRRPLGERRYKRLFVIAAEGTVTERDYFSLFDRETIVRVKCLRSKENLPPDKALEKIQSYLKEESLRKGDEAWVVVDRDEWPEAHLVALHAWSRSRKNYGFALSNPKFEYWLLLHFEDGDGVQTARECDERLAKYEAVDGKHLRMSAFTSERIQRAVGCAERRDRLTCPDWPRLAGSTVYRLIKGVLASRA